MVFHVELPAIMGKFGMQLVMFANVPSSHIRFLEDVLHVGRLLKINNIPNVGARLQCTLMDIFVWRVPVGNNGIHIFIVVLALLIKIGTEHNV
jgi:hypothetical protein